MWLPIARVPLTFVGLTVLVLAGCGKKVDPNAVRTARPYEGQYKNAKGNVVLEIKDGNATFTNPSTRAKTETPFTASGNKLFVESGAGTFSLEFKEPDTMTGLPASIVGDAGPVKK